MVMMWHEWYDEDDGDGDNGDLEHIVCPIDNVARQVDPVRHLGDGSGKAQIDQVVIDDILNNHW